MRAFYTCASVWLSVTACTSYDLGPPTHPLNAFDPGFSGDSARICVISASQSGGSFTFPIRDNGMLVGATRSSTYFCYLAQPGEHTLVTEADSEETTQVSVDAGKSYYLKQDVANVLGAVHVHSMWLLDSEAKPVFSQGEYQVLVGAPSSEKLPTQPPYAPAKPASKLASP